jgi:biopolymer transport protein ExbB/TolQ
MSWSILGLAAIVILVVLAIVFRKNPFVKKYWKILLILIPVAIVLILKIIQDLTTTVKGANQTQTATATKDYIQNVAGQISEVQTVAKVEAAIAKTNNDQLAQKLEDIKKIDDDTQRRQQLAALLG